MENNILKKPRNLTKEQFLKTLKRDLRMAKKDFEQYQYELDNAENMCYQTESKIKELKQNIKHYSK